VAVVGTADEKGGEVGHAFVALNEGASLTLDETLAVCAGKLAKFKIPRHVTVLRDLPKGDSGKILKRKLASAPRSTSPGVSL
jgi:fatty-acyl-CoA synthase